MLLTFKTNGIFASCWVFMHHNCILTMKFSILFGQCHSVQKLLLDFDKISAVAACPEKPQNDTKENIAAG